ncbi:MAG: Ig-like domain-containing protein [Paludibacteraceae bacterium]|nr:Ig-like domain-containing protein [Paludibacteraceae bacterium]
MRLKSFDIVLCLVAMALASCANRGLGPQGGPKDSIPPVVVKETPANGTLHFEGNRLEVQFDEYISLDNVSDNVLVSPPQQTPPEVKAIGKKLTLAFQQPLLDSTTYTIDFGASICDFTEHNPLPNYAYAFSTGDVIDSLSLSGNVYDAASLNPVSGVLVGVHANLHDSAFSTLPFTRIARTDTLGHFQVKNMRAGTYRLYALQDVSRDYLYQPGEGLAFMDTLFAPVLPDSMADTLSLFFFQEEKKRLYFQRAQRKEAHRFSLVFSAPQDSLPSVRPIPVPDSSVIVSEWEDWSPYALWQVSPSRDTLTCWLTDSVAIRQDSLAMALTYFRTDSLYRLELVCDTVLAVWREPNLSPKVRENQQKKARERRLTLASNASSSFEVFDTLRLTSAFPIASFPDTSLRLFHKVDTVYQPMRFTFLPLDSAHLSFAVIFPVEPEEQYELRVDSAAACDIYGVTSQATKFQLKVKSMDEYATIKMFVEPFDVQARLQLLNEKDEVVTELPATESGTLFPHLAPVTYYMRLYLDLNGDGRFTTGDWATHRQPEPVYYFPSAFTLKANWDFEETFRYLSLPAITSKPQAIRKAITGEIKKQK